MDDRRTAPLADYLAALAAPTPAPGGGSAAAIVAASAAALVEMVAGLSIERAPDGVDAARQRGAAEAARALRPRLIALARDDEAAYASFIDALRLPKASDAERTARSEALSRAALAAAKVPLDVVIACADIAESASSLIGRSLAAAASDLEAAMRLAAAAAHISAENVEANLPYVESADERVRVANACAAALERVNRVALADR